MLCNVLRVSILKYGKTVIELKLSSENPRLQFNRWRTNVKVIRAEHVFEQNWRTSYIENILQWKFCI